MIQSLQIFAVEFVVTNHYCPDCHRLAAENTWSATVQVRQKVLLLHVFGAVLDLLLIP